MIAIFLPVHRNALFPFSRAPRTASVTRTEGAFMADTSVPSMSRNINFLSISYPAFYIISPHRLTTTACVSLVIRQGAALSSVSSSGRSVKIIGITVS